MCFWPVDKGRRGRHVVELGVKTGLHMVVRWCDSHGGMKVGLTWWDGGGAHKVE